MPKTFSDSEREYIKKRLLEEAAYCLSHYGVRKTTVDEIVRRANIPKGTFYLFYPSKELLLFDVFCQMHDDYQARMVGQMSALRDDMDPDRMTDIIFGMYKTMEDSFMLRLMTNGELELLFRKLPPEAAALHAEKDTFRTEELAALIPGMKGERLEVFSAALRGIFLSLLHRRDIGEDVFDEALKIMIRGVVIQMFEGETK
jgi:AcrR family transcriptional regulator